MRGKRLFLLLFALGVLGACTQNPPSSSTPEARLQAALSPSQVEVVGEGEAALTLRVEAQGIPGELQLSLAGGEGFALTPDRLPARSGEHRLALRAPKPQTDRQLRLTLRVEGGGKRAELPLEVRHLLPLRAFLEEGGTLLALPREGEALVHLRVEPRRPLGTALSVRAEAAWLTAEPLAPLPEGGGTVPLRLRVRGDAPLGEANLSLTVLLGGERASVPVQARVVEAPPTPTPDLALTLSPTALSVERGRAGTLTLTLLPQGGFGGEVALRLVGAPQGVALEPASVNVGGGSPVTQPLTLRVGQEVPPGTYSLKVQAEAGSLVREASFTLTVTAPAPGPSFTLSSPNPGSLSLHPGESSSFQATLTPQGGFSGQVAFALVRRDTGSPVAGLSLSPTAASLSGSPLTQTFTLTVAGSVAPGAYPLRLRAQGGGVVQEADLDLTVTAPAPGPSFTLSLSPTSLSVEQGGSGNLTLTLTPQGGFTGQVTLSLERQDGTPAPSGLTLSPTNLDVTGTSPVNQTLTLSVASTVPAGTYSLRVRAEGGGLVREAAFTLTVYTLTVSLVEFGQTIVLPAQTWRERALPLVGGKAALLRVHLTAQPGPVSVSGPLTGQMTLSLAGEVRWQGSLTFTCPAQIPTQTSPGDLSTTCNALLPTASLPSSVYAGAEYHPDNYLTLTVTLTPRGGAPAQASVSLRPPIPVKAVVIPVVIDDPDHPAYNQMPDYMQVVNLLPTLLRRHFMVSSVELRVDAPYRTRETRPGYIGVELANLNEQRTGETELYVGVLHGDYFGTGNGGARTAVVSTSPDLVSVTYTITHEVGHAFGMSHSKGCNTPAADPNYPYPDGSIGVYGWDPLAARLTGPLVPNTYKDFMNYCQPHEGSWTSDYTYQTTYRDPWGWGLQALVGY